MEDRRLICYRCLRLYDGSCMGWIQEGAGCAGFIERRSLCKV